MVAGVSSPVDRMYVTPKPAIAILFMVGNLSKRNHHKHDVDPLSLYNQHTITKH